MVSKDLPTSEGAGFWERAGTREKESGLVAEFEELRRISIMSFCCFVYIDVYSHLNGTMQH